VEAESAKAPWVNRLPQGEPLKDEVARLIEVDHDEAEVSLYEDLADPLFVSIERDQRRYRGMFRRRLRHLGSKQREQ
jgi:hypothetical protein